MPPIWPKIQLFGSGLGQLASISNFGACCATAAVTMSANAAALASANVRASFMYSSVARRRVSSVGRFFDQYRRVKSSSSQETARFLGVKDRNRVLDHTARRATGTTGRLG